MPTSSSAATRSSFRSSRTCSRNSPLRERFWAQLMLALYRSGRQADALAAYRRAHNRFTVDLGIEPGIVLRELQRNILVQDPELDNPAGGLGSTLERAAAILPRGRRERAESLYEYGNALVQIGESRQAATMLDAAIRAAVAAREPGLEQRAKLALSFLSIFTEGRTGDDHLVVTLEAIEVFERIGDDADLALGCWHRAHLLWGSGKADEGAVWARRGIAHALRAGDQFREADCRGKLAQCVATGTTPVQAAIAQCQEQLAADCWGEAGFRPVLHTLADLHAHAGRVQEARAFAQRALDQVRAAGLGGRAVAGGLFIAGVVERTLWNLAEAATHLGTAYALLEAEKDRSFLADCGGWHACVLALGGDAEAARRPAEVSRRLANAADPSSDTIWRRAVALIAALDGHQEEAVRRSQEALDRVREMEIPVAQAETLEEAAIVRQLLGNALGARAALEEALELFERKGSVAGASRVRERLARYEIRSRMLSGCR